MIKKNDKIFIAGHNGLVGSAVLRKLKDKNLKILEIGVANGHSTASFYHYFPNAQLYGVDIKKPNYLFYSSKRINYKTIDILDKKKVQKYLNNNNEFDIIIDDSLHTYEGYTLNLRNLLRKLF